MYLILSSTTGYISHSNSHNQHPLRSSSSLSFMINLCVHRHLIYIFAIFIISESVVHSTATCLTLILHLYDWIYPYSLVLYLFIQQPTWFRKIVKISQQKTTPLNIIRFFNFQPIRLSSSNCIHSRSLSHIVQPIKRDDINIHCDMSRCWKGLVCS